MTTQVNATFVTVEEFRSAIADLKARVTGLENLANRLGYAVDVPATETVPESVSDADAPSVSSNGSTTETPATPSNGAVSGVDYGAVAYGLSQIKATMVSHLGSSAELNREYAGAVTWFAACFEGDASFDRATFERTAGV